MERKENGAKLFTTLSIKKLKRSASICTLFVSLRVPEKSTKINLNCFTAVFQTAEQQRADRLYMDIYVCNSKPQKQTNIQTNTQN
jgi:hypothetical protein